MKNKAKPANTFTAYCRVCKTEREFYGIEDMKVCTHCLTSETRLQKKETKNQKELFV